MVVFHQQGESGLMVHLELKYRLSQKHCFQFGSQQCGLGVGVQKVYSVLEYLSADFGGLFRSSSFLF